ncbi:MAG: NAD-dependent epimerase/dehydratase family protein [Gemmatimonadota bacterium]
MRVLLTGATGCVGRAFLRRFRDAPGLEIVATARGERRGAPPGASAWLPSALEELPGRLGRLGPIDACVHAAAVVHRPDAPEEWVRRVNVEQTVALARELAGSHPGARFVFVSSIAAEEPRRSAYARSKAEAEGALGRIAEGGGLEVVTLRLTTVYGPDDRGNIGSLARAVRRGIYVRTVPAEVRKSLVWSRAVAACVGVALDRAGGCSTPAVIADPRPYSLGEIEDALAEALAVRSPRRLPAPLPRVLGAAGSSVRRLTGWRPPYTLDTLRTLGRDVVATPPDEGPFAEAVEDALAGTSLVERFRRSYGPAAASEAG